MNQQSIVTLRFKLSLVGVVLAGASGLLVAGPLNPPAGSVAATYKTLGEVEPRIAINATNTPGDADSLYKITQPGSYYLTGNILGFAGKSGIEIAASNVTIDLGGFHVTGVAGALSGLRALLAISQVTVHNGVVSAWPDTGIDLATASYAAATQLHLHVNGGHGMAIGSNSRVDRCTASQNTLAGFDIYNATSVTDCVANTNGFDGINAAQGCLITDSVASFNTGNGIVAQSGSTFQGNTARDNNSHGISATNKCEIRGNNCSLNGTAGVGGGIAVSGSKNRIDQNLCTDNQVGLVVSIAGGGNFISRNTCSTNVNNWSIAAGNVCLVVSAAVAPAITGNAGGVAPGSTDPNANFTH